MPRWLVILDLNGTLLHRLTKSPEISAARQLGLVPHCSVHQNPIYLRPGVASFLRDLSELVDVAIWTSAQMKNAVPMTLYAFQGLVDLESLEGEAKQIMHNHPPDTWKSGPVRLKFLWAQKECIEKPSRSFKPLFLKDLGRVFKQYPEYGASNTLIVDDSPEKLANWNANHLVIKPYDCMTSQGDDGELARILNSIRDRIQ